MDQLLINLALMGASDRDLSGLATCCQGVSAGTRVPIPHNQSVVGEDAFRSATGVHVADILVLDEPTAPMDAEAEVKVFERFRELTDEQVAIVITQRFWTEPGSSRFYRHSSVLDVSSRLACGRST